MLTVALCPGGAVVVVPVAELVVGAGVCGVGGSVWVAVFSAQRLSSHVRPPARVLVATTRLVSPPR